MSDVINARKEPLPQGRVPKPVVHRSYQKHFATATQCREGKQWSNQRLTRCLVGRRRLPLPMTTKITVTDEITMIAGEEAAGASGGKILPIPKAARHHLSSLDLHHMKTI